MTKQIGDKQAVMTPAESTDSAVPAAAEAAADSATSKPTAPEQAVSGRAVSKPTVSEPTASGPAVPEPTVPGPSRVLDTRHATLRYTTLRLALFLVALLVVWGVAEVFSMDLSSQLSKLTLLAVALLLSSAASFVVLSKQRDEMSAGIVARTQRLSKKFDDAAAFEDEDE